ncbi:MAG: metalloregulator ArsR/SmtB family transcription factor [Candidatus Aenigmatarchaeota archaeon]
MEIDRKTLKALAADTRLDILKSLCKRRKMPSELSRELKLAVPTVTEHLERLEDAGLIRREETGHKWVYYNLTDKGESLVRPRISVQFVIVLSISLLIISAGFVYITSYGGSFASSAPSLSKEAGDSGLTQSARTMTTGAEDLNNTNETNSTVGNSTEILPRK